MTIGDTATVRHRNVAGVELSCVRATGTTCAGTLTLTSRVTPRGKRHTKKTEIETVAFGAEPYGLVAGERTTLTVKLTSAGAKLLDDSVRHVLTAKASGKQSTGYTVTEALTLTG